VKRTVLITLAAIVAFAAILLARMPASWLLPTGPKAPFTCTSIEGSLWSGGCEGLIFQRLPLGDITWELAPARLFLGRLAAQVTLNHDAAHASGDAEVSLSGKVSVRGLLADLPLDPKLLPGVPATLQGAVHADLALLELKGPVITQLKGTVEARNLEDHSGHVTPLGSYLVTFPGGEGEPVGQLRDTGGPLSVEGTLRLTQGGGFDVQALVAPRPDAPPELANNLKFLGSPDATGRRQFSMSGSF
jgi:general secretion pathway protein N